MWSRGTARPENAIRDFRLIGQVASGIQPSQFPNFCDNIGAIFADHPDVHIAAKQFSAKLYVLDLRMIQRIL